jgi:hypothetical protein
MKLLDTYGSSITVIIVILGFLVTLIVEGDKISAVVRRLVDSLDRVPLFLFKAVSVAVSGLIVGSLYWMLVDFLAFGGLDTSFILADIASGAAWGIPPALIATWGKSSASAALWSALVGVISLIVASANNTFVGAAISKADAFSVIWFSTSISVICGLSGYKIRVFLETVSVGQVE